MFRRFALAGIFIFCIASASGQAIGGVAEVRYYAGDFQAATAAFGPKLETFAGNIFLGFELNYAIPVTIYGYGNLSARNPNVYPKTSKISTEIAVSSYSLAFQQKIPFGGNPYKKFLFYMHTGASAGVMNYKVTVGRFDPARYNCDIAPAKGSATELNILAGIGIETRFKRTALFLEPGISVPVIKTPGISVNSFSPLFVSVTLGVKQYLVKNFDKKYGRKMQKKKRRR